MASFEGPSNPSKAWQVQRYSRRTGPGPTWETVDNGSGAYTLHLKTGQLMLVQGGTIFESLPLAGHNQIHALIKGDTLLVASRHQNASRKFKIKFGTVQTAQDCAHHLRLIFPVKEVSKPQDNSPVPLGRMFQQLMLTSPTAGLPNPEPIPASFPLEETLHMCILDPTFCDLVNRVADVLVNFNVGTE